VNRPVRCRPTLAFTLSTRTYSLQKSSNRSRRISLSRMPRGRVPRDRADLTSTGSCMCCANERRSTETGPFMCAAVTVYNALRNRVSVGGEVVAVLSPVRIAPVLMIAEKYPPQATSGTARRSFLRDISPISAIAPSSWPHRFCKAIAAIRICCARCPVMSKWCAHFAPLWPRDRRSPPRRRGPRARSVQGSRRSASEIARQQLRSSTASCVREALL
jgi:hypothetical protein